MALDYSKYLHIKTEEIEGTPVLPLGHYHARVSGWKERTAPYKDEDGQEIPQVRITFKLTAPDDDVDLDGYDQEKFPIAGQLATREYDLKNPNSLKAIRRIAEDACGLNIKGQDLEDTLNDLKGQDVKLYNEPRAGKGEREGEFFTNITKVLTAHES